MIKTDSHPHRGQVPDADLPVRRSGGDDSWTRARTGEVDERDGFDALAFGMATQGGDDLAFTERDDADSACCTSNDGDRRLCVY